MNVSVVMPGVIGLMVTCCENDGTELLPLPLPLLLPPVVVLLSQGLVSVVNELRCQDPDQFVGQEPCPELHPPLEG